MPRPARKLAGEGVTIGQIMVEADWTKFVEIPLAHLELAKVRQKRMGKKKTIAYPGT